jgi:hypothetical protein
MKKPLISLYHSLLALICLAFVFNSTGCDTFGNQPETVSIPTDVQLDFLVNSKDIVANTPKVLQSTNSIDLSAILAAQNFTKTSVKTVSIESATLELVVPSSAPISSLKNAKFSLESAGVTTSQVAAQGVFPQGVNDDTVSLTVDATKEVSAFVKAANFKGNLELTTGTLVANKDYEFQVRLKLIMQVGF